MKNNIIHLQRITCLLQRYKKVIIYSLLYRNEDLQICANYNQIYNIQIITTMNQTDQDENIRNLPLQERVVAVALKHIFDQIKVIQQEQNKEIQVVHHSFISKFKQIEEKSNAIISGEPISQNLLENQDKFFTQTQNAQVKEIGINNKGITAYWLTSLLNFYGEDLSLADREISTAINSISTNVLEDRLEITFEFAENAWISSGKVTRKFILQEGLPKKIEGDKPNWLKNKPEGVIGNILSETNTENLIVEAFTIASEFINEIVPYSLQYFLGDTEEQSYDDGEDLDQEDDQEDEDQGPAKKVKQ